MIAGYPVKDVKSQLKIHGVQYQELRAAVREKALGYLLQHCGTADTYRFFYIKRGPEMSLNRRYCYRKS
jgi:hypothetical protein